MEEGRRGDWYTSISLSLNAATAGAEELGGARGREGAEPTSPDARLSPSSMATDHQRRIIIIITVYYKTDHYQQLKRSLSHRRYLPTPAASYDSE